MCAWDTQTGGDEVVEVVEEAVEGGEARIPLLGGLSSMFGIGVGKRTDFC